MPVLFPSNRALCSRAFLRWSAGGRCRNRKTWWRSQTWRFFLLRAAIFRSLLRTSVPSKQSLATASRFRSSTLLFLLLLERDLLRFVDRATLAAHR